MRNSNNNDDNNYSYVVTKVSENYPSGLYLLGCLSYIHHEFDSHLATDGFVVMG